MRRPRFRKPAVSMSLFPFLAVLVCTMGVLIVLLISLVQQARVYADQARESAAADNSSQSDTALREQFDDLQWQRDVLENQRKELAGNLSDQRLQLSHLEEHIRRLEQQFKELQQQAETLAKVGEEHSSDAEKARAELGELKSRIEEARRKREKIQDEVSKRPRRFAIIPYAGPNGTRRRPIYIECTERGIILQPEGIVLHASDFEGPLGPGNPLDAALRTEREYLAKSGQIERDGEPYPLLVVRPDGAVAYTVARAAMKSWDEEFGYELIEQDIQLEFPPADPNLRGEIERTIVDARQRQAALAMAMPSQFRNRAEEQGFVATPTRGGFVPTAGGGGGFGSGTGGEFGTGSGFAPGGGDRGLAGGGGRSGGGRGARKTGTGGQGLGSGTADSGTAAGNGSGTAAGGRSGNVASGRPGSGQGGPGGSAGQPLGSDSDQARPGGGSSQGNFALAGSSDGTSGSAAGTGAAGMPGGSRARSGDEQSAGGEGNSGSDQGTASSGSESRRNDAKPLADKRGKNWALPKSKSHPTGITRPIYIKCLPDQLIILPEKGDQRTPKVIATPGAIADSADEFVSAIWKHMDQWGLAVAGGYWKPVLQVTVARGADDRLEELRTVLQGSGIEVVRKER